MAKAMRSRQGMKSRVGGGEGVVLDGVWVVEVVVVLRVLVDGM